MRGASCGASSGKQDVAGEYRRVEVYTSDRPLAARLPTRCDRSRSACQELERCEFGSAISSGYLAASASPSRKSQWRLNPSCS